MKTNLIHLAMGTMLACGMVACQSPKGFTIEHQGDTLTVVHVSAPGKYLLLPIQESSNEGKVKLETGSPADMAMDVRLAVDSIEYYVPFEIPQGGDATVSIRKVVADAVCWEHIQLTDTFDTSNTDYYRPVYHHTPLYGWMNDPNGMVYKDGEYHLYFQYNPYGSKWGNMHWGHSVSTDLIHWNHLKPAIARDTLGHIFSGSTVVDKNNTAGYGDNALIALYTSASDEHGQIQCMAYSTDDGRTYTKYEKNPVLLPFDGLKDFRDPKVFWYEPDKKWVMIVSADKEMRFYASQNLKDWEYMSAFGKGYGAQPNQFECPDFIQLPVDGDKNKMKWVMLVNINPGCMFGGSATEYFVGDFDGKEFTCDTKPETVKWLDYGKDHYAAVCISNTGERIISIPWMSNWQYANVTPIRQYRGANGLPRELSLYTKDGQIYVAADVVKEVEALRKDTRSFDPITVKDEYKIDEIVPQADGAYELEMDITPNTSGVAGFDLMNAKGEVAKIYLDMKSGKLVMDRTASGLVAFGEKSEPHAKETDDHRKTMSVNYQNDFALGTWAPLSLCEGKTYHLNVFVDKCSVEIFVDGGRIAMTNLVFPTEPYNTLRFYTEGGEAQVSNMKVYKLGL
ncbi:glycosyl hydrolase family 32 domain protein [Bacteroides sp. CAG:702]|uniref:GH32 C-terminal domain-containing protein n=1 Tax=Bacteroides gallinaceum TaxID=1462571 RepID=UPI000336A9F2|nr:GH32 C-terminal domain-containing protein [Bacteroides gallinaceum]MBM6720655.1 GH32 C-terminal domain-containing protein [Bacteroides gallinaceum]CCZ71028.1 glycosyl hydrolase family 32 domain protein [Bacteroides sp. CAG:702]